MDKNMLKRILIFKRRVHYATGANSNGQKRLFLSALNSFLAEENSTLLTSQYFNRVHSRCAITV